MGHARRDLMLERRRSGSAQSPDDPGEQDGQSIAAGVDDARLAQHRKQVRAALDRLLAGVERALDHLGDHGVLLVVAGLGREARVGHVRQVGGDAMCHLADDGQDRALGRLADRAVGLVGGPRQRGSDQHRVDELAGRLASSSAAPRISWERITPELPRAPKQRRAGDRAHDLVPADVVDRALLGGVREAVELLHHRPQRQHHVVAGVAVGDREHVEVVDLLAARLERRQAGLYDRAEAKDARVGHDSLPLGGAVSTASGL